jgi:hypothetical protein
MNNGTFGGGARTLDSVFYHSQFYDWLEGLTVKNMYKEEEYPGMPIPEYRQNAIPMNNILISPVRLTQRQMKT